MSLSSLTGFDFSILVSLAPYILILGGFVAVSKFLSLIVKGVAGKILKGITYLGLVVGALLLVTGVMVLLESAGSFEVWALLIITGLGLVLKPLTKIPFSALLGLTVGLLCAGLLYVYFPLPSAILGVSSMWIYLAVFLVPALIVFVIFKFAEDLAKLFGSIVGSWPVMAILGFLCLAEGILLLFNMSLLGFFG